MSTDGLLTRGGHESVPEGIDDSRILLPGIRRTGVPQSLAFGALAGAVGIAPGLIREELAHRAA